MSDTNWRALLKAVFNVALTEDDARIWGQCLRNSQSCKGVTNAEVYQAIQWKADDPTYERHRKPDLQEIIRWIRQYRHWKKAHRQATERDREIRYLQKFRTVVRAAWHQGGSVAAWNAICMQEKEALKNKMGREPTTDERWELRKWALDNLDGFEIPKLKKIKMAGVMKNVSREMRDAN